jgi:hypothetical protein
MKQKGLIRIPKNGQDHLYLREENTSKLTNQDSQKWPRSPVPAGGEHIEIYTLLYDLVKQVWPVDYTTFQNITHLQLLWLPSLKHMRPY